MNTVTLTRQEMLNKAYIGVLTYGYSAATSADGLYRVACKYRLDGTAEGVIRCGVGHLIPDEMYTPELEDMAIDDDPNTDIARLFNPDDLEFLGNLQQIHDDAASMAYNGEVAPDDRFKRDMRKLAAKYDLEMPEAPITKG